jgi:hypothetical protein
MESYFWVAIAAGTSLGILIIWIWRGQGQEKPSHSRIEDATGVEEARYPAAKKQL